MIYDICELRSRAATAENPGGEKGAGGKSRNGRKGNPCIEHFLPGGRAVLLNTEGPGMIRHIWVTVPPGNPLHMRNIILRAYWNGQTTPSVECPLGDFFGVSHGAQRPLLTQYISMQEGKGFNCSFPMPFSHSARIEIENDSEIEVELVFYQIDYTLGDSLGENTGYFHAQFRRQNPCPIHTDYTILDGVSGKGHFVGAVLGVRNLYTAHLAEWWGEGEVKFYLDGDKDWPTVCGTGTEDYIGSGWGTQETITPHQGACIIDDDKGYYSFYRFHIMDPVYFSRDIRVTIQQLGAGKENWAREFYGDAGGYYRAVGTKEEDGFCIFERSDDYASVAYWYQTLPTTPFPPLPSRKMRSAYLMDDKNKEETK